MYRMDWDGMGYAAGTGVAITEMNGQILSHELFVPSDMHSVSIWKKDISFPYQGHKHPCLRTTSNLEKKKKYFEKTDKISNDDLWRKHTVKEFATHQPKNVRSMENLFSEYFYNFSFRSHCGFCLLNLLWFFSSFCPFVLFFLHLFLQRFHPRLFLVLLLLLFIFLRLLTDEKTAPPINARLQKGHCIFYKFTWLNKISGSVTLQKHFLIEQ